MTYVVRYKGRELTLPLSDENREFLIARSKDTLINQLDREWANIDHNNKIRGIDVEDEGENEDPEEIPYSEWTKAELAAEISERVEAGATIDVDPKANKPELIAALETDDASAAAE